VNVSDEEIVIPCYCTCDSFGHDNLLYCFYKNVDPKEGFDEHGAIYGPGDKFWTIGHGTEKIGMLAFSHLTPIDRGTL
jgi:hypothetical protein